MMDKDSAKRFIAAVASSGSEAVGEKMVDWLLQDAKGGRFHVDLASVVIERYYSPGKAETPLGLKLGELTGLFLPHALAILNGKKEDGDASSGETSKAESEAPMSPATDDAISGDFTAQAPVNDAFATSAMAVFDALNLKDLGLDAKTTTDSGVTGCATGTCGSGVTLDLGLPFKLN